MIPKCIQNKKEHKELENKINGMNYLSILGSISDNETMNFSVESRKVYLFINSHIHQRCIILITIFNNTIATDIIYKSSDNATPTISLDNNIITITSPSLCRGKLF